MLLKLLSQTQKNVSEPQTGIEAVYINIYTSSFAYQLRLNAGVRYGKIVKD